MESRVGHVVRGNSSGSPTFSFRAFNQNLTIRQGRRDLGTVSTVWRITVFPRIKIAGGDKSIFATKEQILEGGGEGLLFQYSLGNCPLNILLYFLI